MTEARAIEKINELPILRWEKEWGHSDLYEALSMAIWALERQRWIPVTEEMPEEHDSIFAKWKGTNRWSSGMFEKISDNVSVTVEYENGTRITQVAHTTDGKWTVERVGNKVVAWQPLPEPFKEGVEQ